MAISIEIKCSECNRELSYHEASIDNFGDPVLSMDPCAECLEDARKKERETLLEEQEAERNGG